MTNNQCHNFTGLFGNSFQEYIDLSSSSNIILNGIMAHAFSTPVVPNQFDYKQLNKENNYHLSPFRTDLSTDLIANIQRTANNISPEKSSSLESSSECSTASSTDSEESIEFVDSAARKVRQKKKKRKVKASFITNPKERASVKFRRKIGIIKKIKLFDTLTGSNSAFLSFCQKNKLSSYSKDGSKLADLMPKITDLALNSKKRTKNAYASCDLNQDSKYLIEPSNRILNCDITEKVIYTSSKISTSKSVDFSKVSSSDEVINIEPSLIVKRATKKNKQKENIAPKKSKMTKRTEDA